ncbi:MAG: ABC transporter permease [Armatimonadota bacterium]
MIAPTEMTNTPTEPAEAPVTVILPPRGWRSLKLRELWDYRELLYFLALRDVKVRYKQTGLGIAWALLQPFVTMVVFTFVFQKMAGLKADNGIPYPIFTFAALLPWQLFAGALPRISNSLVGNANLLTKVYFPRMAIPLAAMGAGLVDFIISFALLVVLIVWFSLTSGWHFVWSWALLALPLFMLLAMLTSLAVGLWFAALNVQYRDVQHITPFLVQVWMFISPVVYSTNEVPAGAWRALYSLNPMAGVIQGFRWALLGGSPPDAMMAISVGMVALLLAGGLYFFRYMERYFADVI